MVTVGCHGDLVVMVTNYFSFRYFDKNQSGRLEHQEFKASLRSLGYELAVLEQGQTDPKFEAILDQVDPNR